MVELIGKRLVELVSDLDRDALGKIAAAEPFAPMRGSDEAYSPNTHSMV